jgi:type II secretory pathway component PulC
MKKIFIVILIFIVNLYSSELDWVNEQISAIKPQRSGLKSTAIRRLRDPFIFIREKGSKDSASSAKKVGSSAEARDKKVVPQGIEIVEKRVKRVNFNLSAIINKSALINGQWYGLNDRVRGYKLRKINKTFVVLSRNGRNILLSTDSRNTNIKFKNK